MGAYLLTVGGNAHDNEHGARALEMVGGLLSSSLGCACIVRALRAFEAEPDQEDLEALTGDDGTSDRTGASSLQALVGASESTDP
jgi:hypothetical protein